MTLLSTSEVLCTRITKIIFTIIWAFVTHMIQRCLRRRYGELGPLQHTRITCGCGMPCGLYRRPCCRAPAAAADHLHENRCGCGAASTSDIIQAIGILNFELCIWKRSLVENFGHHSSWDKKLIPSTHAHCALHNIYFDQFIPSHKTPLTKLYFQQAPIIMTSAMMETVCSWIFINMGMDAKQIGTFKTR